jgi:hypothetical protein
MWPIRQRGSPREERRPWRLIAIVSFSSCGGGLEAFEPIRPETLTETGAVPWRGSFLAGACRRPRRVPRTPLVPFRSAAGGGDPAGLVDAEVGS